MIKNILILVLLFNNAVLLAQYSPLHKGKMYAYWGWNRGAYSKSDIRLKGADYNIKLYNVKAHDKPISCINYNDYFKIDRVTIPQTNFRIGYFIKDGLALSLGVDHMKYIMTQDQTVDVKGVIARPGIYAKAYNGPQVMKEDFLTFEHTDGLNYIHGSVEKYKELFRSKDHWLIINGYYGGGVGVMLPKTNVKLLDYERNDRFHVSGFGIDAAAGLQTVLFKRILLRLESKFGYINMPDIILHKKGIEGRGKQHFYLLRGLWLLGEVLVFKRLNKSIS